MNRNTYFPATGEHQREQIEKLADRLILAAMESGELDETTLLHRVGVALTEEYHDHERRRFGYAMYLTDLLNQPEALIRTIEQLRDALTDHRVFTPTQLDRMKGETVRTTLDAVAALAAQPADEVTA